MPDNQITKTPFLTLNTGMHSAMMRRCGTDSRGRYLLTASEDKTAKLWNLATGELLQTLRPPIGEGNEGLLNACTLSQDGQTAVVSGWTSKNGLSNSIYIFNARTGAMTARITGLPNVIFDLEFSPDQRFLAASMFGSNGIKIYRTSDYSLVVEDKDYQDDCYNVSFDIWGRLATVSYDGHIRLYSADFQLTKKEAAPGGRKPYSLAFSPDGTLLAVGYDDSAQLQVLDANTLLVKYEPDISDANVVPSHLEMVAFSADGTQLAAGHGYQKITDGDWWRQVRIWDDAGRGAYGDCKASKNSILDIKPLPYGGFVYVGAMPDWGVITEAKELIQYQQAAVQAFNAIDKSHFRLGLGGEEVGVKPYAEKELYFNVPTRQLVEGVSNEPFPVTERPGFAVTDWLDGYEPKLNGVALHLLDQYERCRSAAIATGGAGLILGAEWNLYCAGADGTLRWKQSIPGIGWCVNVDKTNRIVAAALGNGTIRWFQFLSGQHLLTLYIHPDRQRWVLWTTSGYFDCAPGAEALLGWHLNQGADRESAYYPLSKFRDQYYRPDIIDRILDTLDEAEAVRQANAARGKADTPRGNFMLELPPIVRILSPSDGTELFSNNLDLAFVIESPTNDPVSNFMVLINGQRMVSERGEKPLGQRLQTVIPVPSADCVLSIIAENRFGASEPASVQLKWKGAAQAQIQGIDIRPKLYVLAIGVSKYQNANIPGLAFADKDAEAFSALLQEQKGGLYADVQVKLLTDELADKDSILDGLDWLERQTTSKDVAMLFFAGHGVDDNNGNFYYLPSKADPESFRRTAIGKGEVQSTVASVTGKIIVFMDACRSGALMEMGMQRRALPEIAPVINELVSAENGAVVFCSTTNRQYALENPVWGHGAFTKALLEGISGQACFPGTHKITVKTLDAYVAERVKDLTDGKQSPTTVYPPNVPDFPVSVSA